jgi:heme-degrading monooxygenase HmoA
MIARTWHGRVPASKAEAYYEYLQRTGISDYHQTPGNRGVFVLRRTEGGVTHYQILTLWDSVEAIKRFAGPDYRSARYYPEDDDFLLEREPHVVHDEVLEGRMQGTEVREGR